MRTSLGVGKGAPGRSRGPASKQGRTTQLSFRVEPELADRIRRAADSTNTALATTVRLLIEDGFRWRRSGMAEHKLRPVIPDGGLYER